MAKITLQKPSNSGAAAQMGQAIDDFIAARPKTGDHPSNVVRAMSEMDKELTRLCSLFETLEKRLEAVTVSRNDETGDTDSPPAPPACELAYRLDNFTTVVSRVSDKLTRLINNLDI